MERCDRAPVEGGERPGLCGPVGARRGQGQAQHRRQLRGRPAVPRPAARHSPGPATWAPLASLVSACLGFSRPWCPAEPRATNWTL
eukprot:12592511-Alexandrium_andersonii.AAC.2